MTRTVAVVGRGPIGAATAQRLAMAGVRDVALVAAAEPEPGEPAYRSSGGSVCWHRSDPTKKAMIRRTAEFIRARVAAGAPVRVRDTPYLFLDAGVLAPALNVAAADLVADLVGLAAGGRAWHAGRRRPGHRRWSRSPGGHRVVGPSRQRGRAGGRARARCGQPGAGRRTCRPGWRSASSSCSTCRWTRSGRRSRTWSPRSGAGYAYVFVKETPDGLRVVVGQEDLVAGRRPDRSGRLVRPSCWPPGWRTASRSCGRPGWSGSSGASTGWTSCRQLVEHRPGLLTVNCGSAVRACVAIGEQAAARVQRTLAG